ncbi:DnaA N-terminal domain containing protein [Sphingobium cupriresistens]
MSWEAESWARQQRTGDPVTKAVLVGLANWMNPKGDECQVSMRRLADEVEISVRTAQRHIQKLEAMGIVEKFEAQRDDGGQGWNSFRFPTYKPPHVSHVEPAKKRVSPPAKLSPPHANMAGGEGANLSCPPGAKLAGRTASDCRGEGDNGVTPETCKGLDKSPPTPPPGGDAADGKRNRGLRIAENWTPPPIDALPPAAKAKARQWPAGAYQAEAEAFLNFWLSEARPSARKLDWSKAWCGWINRATGQVLRDAKAGVRHTAPVVGGSVQPAKAHDTSREHGAAEKIRTLVRAKLGDAIYDQWFAPSRFDIDGGTLTLVAVSSFASNYQRDNFANDVGTAMHAVLGPDAELRFHHERPPA